MSQTTQERVAQALGELPYAAHTGGDGTLVLEVEREHVAELLAALKQRAGFDANTFVTAIDHEPRAPRFELCWQFLSFAHNDRVRVSCRVEEADARVPTCTHLWPGASFSERECYDMFGIHFDGHPDLRRLLMPEGYTHHPLRKDFPHQGIEPDRLYREWDEARRSASADL